jgi:hypothetical protein
VGDGRESGSTARHLEACSAGVYFVCIRVNFLNHHRVDSIAIQSHQCCRVTKGNHGIRHSTSRTCSDTCHQPNHTLVIRHSSGIPSLQIAAEQETEHVSLNQGGAAVDSCFTPLLAGATGIGGTSIAYKCFLQVLSTSAFYKCFLQVLSTTAFYKCYQQVPLG